MNLLKLSGTLLRELSLKTDKNGNDYFLGKLILSDGSAQVFFFFGLNYDLSMRLVDLKTKQKLTLQGYWGKREPRVFLANDFYLEEEFKEQSFSFFEKKFEF